MDNREYTALVYEQIQRAVDAIEKRFFTDKGKLGFPKMVLAINNMCASGVRAFVSPDSLFDKGRKEKVQYLALNPAHLAREPKDTLATLCHELCHVYECRYIHIPRNGYHTDYWCELMRGCGLEPVFHNRSRTSCAERIIEGGEFDAFCKDFLQDGEEWIPIVEYREGMEKGEDGGDGDGNGADNAGKVQKKYNRNKVKYTCPDCGCRVWGKAGLNIQCNDCGEDFEEEEG